MVNRCIAWIAAFAVLGVSSLLRADDKPKSEKPDAEKMEKKDEKPSPTASTKQTPQTVPGKNTAITQAITALSQEFKSNQLREKSDYFGKAPSPEVTPPAIVEALERPIPGGPRAEAYVKWQLLSAIPGKFPEDLAKRVLAVYRRAPYPAEHPGLDRRNLDRTVGGLRKEEMAAANKEFARLIQRLNQANEPILAYRAGLFERLPGGYDEFAAGLADLHLRVSHGLKSDRFFDTVAAGIRSWTIGADRGQLGAIGNGLYELKAALDQRNAKPYKEIFEDKGVKWKTDQAIDPKKIDVLIEFMEQAANSPAGGLKFKNEKK
jgi:hypothetical protein